MESKKKLKVLRPWASLFLLVFLLFSLGYSRPSVRGFDPEMMEEYHSDSDFDYSSNYANGDSFVTLILLYILDLISPLFNNPNSGPILEVIIKILFVMGIIMAVFYILRLRYGSFFSRQEKSISSLSVELGAVENMDYNILYRKASKEGRFQDAIRYLFIKTLIELEKNKAIELKSWKAPWDYIREVNEHQKPYLTDLVKLYEHIWYGDYSADLSKIKEGEKLAKNLVNE